MEDIFNLVTLAATSEFCEWVQIGTDVYIPHRKFQVRPHSSLWFPFVCLAVIADKTEHRKYLRQKVLEIVQLLYTSKTKKSILVQTNL